MSDVLVGRTISPFSTCMSSCNSMLDQRPKLGQQCTKLVYPILRTYNSKFVHSATGRTHTMNPVRKTTNYMYMKIWRWRPIAHIDTRCLVKDIESVYTRWGYALVRPMSESRLVLRSIKPRFHMRTVLTCLQDHCLSPPVLAPRFL